MSASDAGLEPERGGSNNDDRKGRKHAGRPKKEVPLASEAIHLRNGETPKDPEVVDAMRGKADTPCNGDGSSHLVSVPPPSSLAEARVTEELIVRDLDRLALALTKATDPKTIKGIGDQAAVLKDIARRMKMATRELNRFGEIELRAARELGKVLAQGLIRCRPRKGYGTRNLPEHGFLLPDDVSGNVSSECQKLAAWPDAEFEAFLERKKARGERITRAAALRACRLAAPPARLRMPRVPKLKVLLLDGSIWLPVWEAVWQIVKVDLAIGVDPKLVKAPQGLEVAQVLPNKLKGNVLAKVDDRVEEWLNMMFEAKRARDVSRAILAFTATTSEPWFQLIDRQGWTCCFLRGAADRAAILAYLSDNPRRLALELHRLGAVLFGGQTQDDGR